MKKIERTTPLVEMGGDEMTRILWQMIKDELLLPYILEYIIDGVAPRGRLGPAVGWGLLMFAAALVCRQLNVTANRRGIRTAHRVSYDIRQALFCKTANLSGSQFDGFGLPSLISRMTSDSYNVQSAVQQLQTLCVRAPMLLVGGVLVALVMDASLAMILVAMLPVLILVVLVVTARGLPLYTRVQQRLDTVVRVMRENITGIRVVKALSKTDYEKRRFAEANRAMADGDITAGTVMAIPSPLMQLCLNGGLSLVVFFGAVRVNRGAMEPGVILAFLTYFNMITMGVMGLSRIFMTMSKAGASADRIDQVLKTKTDQRVLPESEARTPSGDEFIRFEHVNFSYGEELADASGFAGEAREKALTDISFAVRRGESLGIIGPTGCGKSTIISLLMRFYDVEDGGVFVDGRDVRTYEKDRLREKFGVCFQNDMVFQDTLRENIGFGRALSEEALRAAVRDAMAAEYIDALADGASGGDSGGEPLRRAEAAPAGGPRACRRPSDPCAGRQLLRSGLRDRRRHAPRDSPKPRGFHAHHGRAARQLGHGHDAYPCDGQRRVCRLRYA